LRCCDFMRHPIVTFQQVRRVLPVMAAAAVITGVQVIPCQSSWGAEIILMPNCDLREEFNDNIMLSYGSKKSDFITTVAPTLGMSLNTERLTSSLTSGVDWFQYAKNETLSSSAQQVQGQAQYRVSPLTSLGAAGGYSHTNQPASINPVTGLAYSSGSQSFNLSGSGGVTLDQLSSVTLNYSYQDQTYVNPALLGSIVHNASSVYTVDLGSLAPLLKGMVTASFSRAIYSTTANNNYALTVGAARGITEKISWSLNGGANYTYSTYKILSLPALVMVDQSVDNWGWIGSAGVTYTGEKGQGNISVNRNFSAGSGQIGATENTSVSLAVSRTETKRFSWQASTSYVINKSSDNQFGATGTDARVFQAFTSLLYRLSDYFDLGMQYSFYNESFRNYGTQVHQNRVLLTFSSHDRFRYHPGSNTLTEEVYHGTR